MPSPRMSTRSTAPEAAQHALWPHLPARPWRYLGATVEKYQACQGAPVQPGACCDHCSTGIYETHHFQAVKTGERFVVGSTCVLKMLKEMGSRSLKAAEAATRKEKNRRARERAAAKRAENKAKALELIDAHGERARVLPSPNAWRAEQGETLEDWARWMVRNGGGNAYKAVIAKLGELSGAHGGDR